MGFASLAHNAKKAMYYDGDCLKKIEILFLLREDPKFIGTCPGQEDGGARTFFRKKHDGLGLFFLENKGGRYFFLRKNMISLKILSTLIMIS